MSILNLFEKEKKNELCKGMLSEGLVTALLAKTYSRESDMLRDIRAYGNIAKARLTLVRSKSKLSTLQQHFVCGNKKIFTAAKLSTCSNVVKNEIDAQQSTSSNLQNKSELFNKPICQKCKNYGHIEVDRA